MVDDLLVHVLTNLGVPGLALFLCYRLADKWASKTVEHFGRYVDASIRQQEATTQLVAAVRESSNDQRDVLLAVRSMSTEISAVKGWVKELDSRLPEARKGIAA